MTAIHTLNARGNVLLPVMRECFALSDARTFAEIQHFHNDCVSILRTKGIVYASLRAALTPQSTKHEAAFLFDEERCTHSYSPGVECAEALFDALDSKTTHSILGGELFGSSDKLARKLLDPIVASTKPSFRLPNTCFVLYVNNLSEGAVAVIDSKLQQHPAYVGYMPCTYSSKAKTFISLNLMNFVIKHGNTIIMAHEDDRPNTQDYNLHMHDYVKQGFRLRSIQSMYFNTFLSYKPERLLLDASDDDLEIALRAMSSVVAPLAKFTVFIEDAKFQQYLQTTKLGKLEKAGLAGLTKAELAVEIRSKLRMNYLYNLEWVNQPTHQLSKFNILLEFPRVGGHPERVVVALEYRPVERILRLLTIT
ncbi:MULTISPECIES: hypothetical protein [Pseudomonas]|uniref:hypothetical protein n=1 Tax=Pseudomonas TaxID=286 RepID=UPI00064060A3|nr:MULTISPECIES: hypothetical protein [Pseudomonas]SIS16029.1 hypothetical protein SAMN05216504_5328 [Pseudomonas sp. A214]